MHATVLDENGKEVPLVMGSYGIGVERILSAAVEQNHDRDGMFLPAAIAPFDVILTAANMDDARLARGGGKALQRDAGTRASTCSLTIAPSGPE